MLGIRYQVAVCVRRDEVQHMRGVFGYFNRVGCVVRACVLRVSCCVLCVMRN